MAPKLLQSTTTRASTRAARRVVRVSAKAEQGVRSAALSSLLLLGSAAAARAEEGDAVDAAVGTAIEVVKAAGGFLKGAVDVGLAGAKLVQQGVEIAAPVVQQGIEAVTPVVREAVKVGGEVAGPAFKAATPTLEAGISEAGKFISQSGVDVGALKSTTGLMASSTQEALPKVSGAVSSLLAQEPLVLGEYALGAAALYLLGPSLLGGLAGLLRGFAGDVTAAAALDALVNDGNTVLVDIRSAKDKEATGVPDVPSAGASKVVEVEFAGTEDRKLRGQLRDAGSIEAQITALQIASLKRVSKGTKILLLDRYGPVAGTVARELASKGFSKVFVIAGGFDGRSGWVQSKLQIKPAASVLSTSPSLSNSIGRTISTRAFPKRALPAPK